jgi:uncharacterized protein YbjT (DUF2867 family)
VPSKPAVLVLGGRGFIGRAVAAALLSQGAAVTVGSRFASNCTLRIRLHEPRSLAEWQALIAEQQVVINCVGILRQRFGETYEQVHHLSPAVLAAACRASGVRYLHVSALGLHASASSRFITSKLRGEAAITAVGGESCLVRPSLLQGEGGFGAYWLQRVANWPVHCVPADAQGRIAPIAVSRLGELMAQAALADKMPATLEVGGPVVANITAYLAQLREPGKRPARVLPVPAILVRLVAHVCDLLHLTPLSWGHVELMRRDNLPASAATSTSTAAL